MGFFRRLVNMTKLKTYLNFASLLACEVDSSTSPQFYKTLVKITVEKLFASNGMLDNPLPPNYRDEAYAGFCMILREFAMDKAARGETAMFESAKRHYLALLHVASHRELKLCDQAIATAKGEALLLMNEDAKQNGFF